MATKTLPFPRFWTTDSNNTAGRNIMNFELTGLRTTEVSHYALLKDSFTVDPHVYLTIKHKIQ